jgi:hypothetical protein
MPTEWVVVVLFLWIVLSLLVVALCASVRRIDEGLGRRKPRVLDPAKPERPARTGIGVERPARPR